MIIVKLMGGLGNQMFQYALGRKLSILNNDIFKLDISDYHKNNIHGTPREYKLNVFNIQESIASISEVQKLRGFDNKILLKLGIKKKSYIKEKITNLFDPDILNLKGDLYLEGYWQNENYFKDIRDILINEFTLKQKRKELCDALNVVIKSNSVVIHIRGGDYIRNENAKKFHGNLDIDYYIKAINIINEKIINPKFYVFTDDFEYANNLLKKIINKLENKFVENNFFFVQKFQLKDFEELMLMKNCRHFIIANSSFSWWGAWLSSFNDKVVVAPKIWFRDYKLRNINPAANEWIKIENIF